MCDSERSSPTAGDCSLFSGWSAEVTERIHRNYSPLLQAYYSYNIPLENSEDRKEAARVHPMIGGSFRKGFPGLVVSGQSVKRPRDAGAFLDSNSCLFRAISMQLSRHQIGN